VHSDFDDLPLTIFTNWRRTEALCNLRRATGIVEEGNRSSCKTGGPYPFNSAVKYYRCFSQIRPNTRMRRNRMRVRFIDIDGIRTRYLYEGKGYPLLLIHGGGVSADTWIRNIDALSKDFFVCAPDLVGHGFTGAVDLKGGPPHPTIVKHLARFVDALELGKFAVAGSSFGAQMSALLYLHMPERVEKLIIVGSGSSFNTEEELTRVRAESYKNAMSAMSDPTLESCRARLANICYDRGAVPEEILPLQLTSYALPEVLSFYLDSRRATVEQMRPYRILERLEEIKVPTLIISGREDVRGIYQRAVEAQKRLPNAKLVTFEKCGHLPYIEHPDLFNRTVQEFLTA
jgi:2-hydroxy-6-oxonona-2,4-dienedioate hydrolase